MKIKYNAELEQLKELKGIQQMLETAEIGYFEYACQNTDKMGSDEARKIHDFCDTILEHRGALEEEIERLEFISKVKRYEPYASLLTLQHEGFFFVLAFGRHTDIASDNGEYEYYAIKPTDNVELALKSMEDSLWERHAVEAAEKYPYETDEDGEYIEDEGPWLECVETYVEIVSLEKLLDTMDTQYGIVGVDIW